MTHELDELLEHSGVKGMKWGVRKDTRHTRKRYRSYNKGMKLLDRSRLKKMTSASARQKYIDDKDAKWLDKVGNDKQIQKVSKDTAREMRRVNKELKDEYGGRGIKGEAKRAMDGRLNAAYRRDMKAAYEEVLADHTYKVYKMSPSRTREVEIQSLSDGTLKATVVTRNNPKLTKQRAAIVKATNKLAKREAQTIKQSLLHADQEEDLTNLDGMFFYITLDEDGFPDEIIEPFEDSIEQGDEIMKSELEDLLLHYGVKGMKWRDVKEKTEEVVEDASDSVEDTIKKSKKAGKKVSNLDDALKKFGDKKLKSIKSFIKDIKSKNDEKPNGKISGIKYGGKLPKTKKRPKLEGTVRTSIPKYGKDSR